MTETRFFEILAKKYAGELSLHEHKELLDFVQAHPEFANLLKEVEHLYSTPIYGKSADEEQAISRIRQVLLNKIHEEEQPAPVIIAKPAISWVRVLVASAAASLLLFMAHRFFYGPSKETIEKDNIVFTKKGSKTNLILPDGSQVWLNADSKISYGSGFSKESRELTLIGEAYFDVIKDPVHPFIIHTKELDIKVLGTAFNVRAYPDEKNTEATLIRGAIEATLKGYDGQKVILKPFEKISVFNTTAQNGKAIDIQTADSAFFTLQKVKNIEADSITAETQWLKNRLVFNKVKLGDIAERLGRFYGVDIVIKDDKLKEKEYNGVFQDMSLRDVLESLHLAGGFNYSIEGKTVTIVP